MRGRPVEYTEEVVDRAEHYLQESIDTYDEFHKTRGEKSDGYDRLVKVNLPTIEGLALFLNVHRDTIYDWEKKYENFSYTLDKIRTEQKKRLILSGLSGDYNPVIAKLVLASNHGMSDKTDITSGGEKIFVVPPELIKKNEPHTESGNHS